MWLAAEGGLILSNKKRKRYIGPVLLALLVLQLVVVGSYNGPKADSGTQPSRIDGSKMCERSFIHCEHDEWNAMASANINFSASW